MKKAFAASSAILLLVPSIVYSHCHNDAAFENPLTVRGNKVWSPDEKTMMVYMTLITG